MLCKCCGEIIHTITLYAFYSDANLLFLGINCTPPAIEDFPHDLFDEEQRQGGAVVVHVIVSLYLFIALAVVCDKFFVPAVEKICHGKDRIVDFCYFLNQLHCRLPLVGMR